MSEHEKIATAPAQNSHSGDLYYTKTVDAKLLKTRSPIAIAIVIELAKLVARDGEGATKLIECVVEGALTEETAARLSKAVITSTMVKAAVFGSDANWGRILCAIGCEGSEFDPDKIDIIFESKKGYIEVCKDGIPLQFSEKKARSILEDDEITIIVDLKMGDAMANAWG